MSIPLNTIYSYFRTGNTPTQKEFEASWSSFWHKFESIPVYKIDGLENLLQTKTDKNIYETHVSDPGSHADYLAKKNASNLDSSNVQAWKTALGVGEQPANIATVDQAGYTGTVYTKNQSDSKYMFLNDFVNDDRKILAEKIEALGLTNLIESAEKSISEFTDHADAYEFEDNDFIAVPDVNGNFSLYMFKGGEKSDKNNYLPTGISNITTGMVGGLQGELNKKIDTPLTDGKFYIKRTSGVTTTETMADETLASVINRNSYSPKGISFVEDVDGSGNPGTNVVLGANKNTYSFFFGNMNPAHTGVYNIALGYSSLSSVTSGEINTIIGHFAGKDITTGSANIALGYESARGLLTGKDNTLIGNSAGYGLKNGSGNSMLGKWTGCFITGSNNTFLGYQAGQFWGRGGSGLWSSNIVIGAGTSGHSNGIWGENNLIIGSNIELIGAQSNKFIINNFLGKDNNYYKTHFIEGNFADRWLRFDTSLQVLRLPVADASFTKDVVARPDGTFGLDDKKEYIPLKGTVAGKPVTGEIEFSTEGGGAIKSGVAKISVTDGYTTIFSGDPAGEKTQIVSSPQQIAISQGLDKYINLTKELNRIDVGAPANGPGVVGKNYYGDNYDDNSFVQKKWVEQKVQAIPGKNYKIYRALLNTVRGSFEPAFIELENTIGDIKWGHVDSGQYLGTLPGAFTADKVWVNAKVNKKDNNGYPDCYFSRSSTDSVYLNVFDMASKLPIDIEGQFGVIEIYVYN